MPTKVRRDDGSTVDVYTLRELARLWACGVGSARHYCRRHAARLGVLFFSRASRRVVDVGQGAAYGRALGVPVLLADRVPTSRGNPRFL